MYREGVSAPDSTIGPPAGLLVEITSRCNLVCRMCPLTTGLTPSSEQPGPMADPVWTAIVRFARQAGHVNIGGYGEPLLNPNCLDYLRTLDREGVRTTLTTNGTLVTPAIAAGLAELPHLVSVNISIDSPDPAIYKSIRGGSVDKALSGVGLLAAALRPSQLTVSSVMMRSTMDSLPAFPARLATIGVRTYVLQGLVDYAPGLEPEELHWRDGLARHVELMKQAAEAAGTSVVFELPERVAAEMRDPVDVAREAAAVPTPHEVTDTKQCFAPWDTPVFDKDGRVFPCCYAMTHASAVLGNVKETSPEAIWQGEKFEAFRAAIVDGRTLPDVCRQCTVVPTGPHPLRLYSTKLLLDRSTLAGTTAMILAVRNAGARTWTRDDRVYLGTAAPRDGDSAFYDATWIGRNRICSFREDQVPPGGTATFVFIVNPADGVETESFQIVVEGQCWVPGTLFQIRPEQPHLAPSAPKTLLARLRTRLGF